MSHSAPQIPKRNPHPVKRYEITATADAPGSWDSVKGYISYDVINEACTPEDKFLGAHARPQGVGLDIEMTQTDEKTWKGYFYRDYLADEDYYGLGACHWDASSIAGVFFAHGAKFSSGSLFKSLLQDGPQSIYFRKRDFLDKSQKSAVFNATIGNPKVIEDPNAFFPITVTIREEVQ